MSVRWRYATLASLYTKQVLPGVGASLGLDRLVAALEELGRLKKSSTPAPVLLVQFMRERLGEYARMARSSAGRRHWRRALSRSQENRPAAPVCRSGAAFASP